MATNGGVQRSKKNANAKCEQGFTYSLLAFIDKYGVLTNQWTWFYEALLEVPMTEIAMWIRVCADDWAAESAIKASDGYQPSTRSDPHWTRSRHRLLLQERFAAAERWVESGNCPCSMDRLWWGSLSLPHYFVPRLLTRSNWLTIKSTFLLTFKSIFWAWKIRILMSSRVLLFPSVLL